MAFSSLNNANSPLEKSLSIRQGFPVLAKSGSAEGGSPLPVREVSSQLSLLPAAAGGEKENWKALSIRFPSIPGIVNHVIVRAEKSRAENEQTGQSGRRLERKFMQQPGYFTFSISTMTPPVFDPRATLPRADEANEVASILSNPQIHTVLLTGGPGIGKSTLAALVFEQFQQHLLEGLPGFRYCIWLRPGPRASWPDVINALLNTLVASGQTGDYISQQASIQALYDALRRPGQGALIVLDQCEEFFEGVSETQNQGTPYTVGIGLSSTVRFLEMLSQDLGESRVILTCTRSPFGSDYHETPGVREYGVGGLTIVEGIHLLQQRNMMGLQQDLSAVWQRCSGHVYTLLLFSALKHLSGLSLHYLLNSPAYQILWEGNVTQNLIEAVTGFLNPIQMSLIRALCLFREPVPLAGMLEVVMGERAILETDLQSYDQEARNLAVLGLLEQIERYNGEIGYQLHSIFARYLLSHYLDGEQRRASSYLSSSLGVANSPMAISVNDEARQIALAAGHMRVADYYRRVARQVCPPLQQRSSPNDVVPLLAMLEHLCLGWQWQAAYDQMYSLELDEDLLRWETWHTLIRLYEMMLPPTGSLQRRAEGLVCSALGMIYSRLGEFEQSRAYFTSALAIQRDMGDQQSEALTLTNQGEFLRVLGDKELARQNFTQALSLLNPSANPELACVLTHNMALLAQEQGDYQQSLRYFMQALSMVRQHQDSAREGMILTNIGLLLCEQQRYQEGLALLIPALQTRYTRHDASTAALIAFLNKLEQRMGNETFASLRQTAQIEGQQEEVLRMLAQ
jgi:Tfp pilus assembly protein PilF